MAEGSMIDIQCPSCGHTVMADMPEFVKGLCSEFQNELDWYKQRVAELEEEILVLTQFDGYNGRNHN